MESGSWNSVNVRPDIDAAFARLDSSGQGSITGLRTPRQVRKGFEKLPELLPDEQVLALAVANDPPPTASQQRSMGAAASLGAISQVAKSARLLVLTETNLWEVQASGRLNGSQPKGIRHSLVDITDVRTLSERKLGRFGAKQRVLAIDHLQGAQVETIVHEISGSDQALELFAQSLAEQVGAVGEAVAAAKRSESAPRASVADELTKLVQLHQNGVLTSSEFEAQKAKLLEGG